MSGQQKQPSSTAAMSAISKKPSSWIKKHQTSVAVVGALLSLGTYFGKETILEHSKSRAEELEQADRLFSIARVQLAAHDQGTITALEVHTLTEDALALEQHRPPTAILGRRSGVSAGAFLDAAQMIVKDSQARMQSISAIAKALPDDSPGRKQFNEMDDELDRQNSYLNKEREDILDAEAKNASQADLENEARDAKKSFIAAQKVMQQFLSLYRALPDEARRERKTDQEHARTISNFLSIIFVFGLLLSLAGKIGGGDGEAPEV